MERNKKFKNHGKELFSSCLCTSFGPTRTMAGTKRLLNHFYIVFRVICDRERKIDRFKTNPCRSSIKKTHYSKNPCSPSPSDHNPGGTWHRPSCLVRVPNPAPFSSPAIRRTGLYRRDRRRKSILHGGHCRHYGCRLQKGLHHPAPAGSWDAFTPGSGRRPQKFLAEPACSGRYPTGND